MADHHDEDAPDVDYEGEEEEEQHVEAEIPVTAAGGSVGVTDEASSALVAKPGAGDSETDDDSDDDDDPRPAPEAAAVPHAGGKIKKEEGINDKESEDGEIGGGDIEAPPPSQNNNRDNADDDDATRGYRRAPTSSKMDRALDAPREMPSERPKEERTTGGNDFRDNRSRGRDYNYNDRNRMAMRKQPFEENVGVYIPPAKRRLLEDRRKAQEALAAAGGGGLDRSSGVEGVKDSPNGFKGSITANKVTPVHTQRQSWESLQRSINGTINRLSPSTIKPLIHSLFSEANLLRGRGVLARSVLRASQASPQYAPTYAALMAVVNTKLPECGELLLTRAILEFRRGYKRRDRNGVSSTLALLGHLFNQGMAHELLSLQILTVLLDGDPTEDSVDVAVGYMCVVGRQLTEVSPAGVRAVMERFRGLLHEGSVGRRGQYRIETLLKIKRGGFKDYPTIPDAGDLDLVEREDQITFELGLDDEGLSNEMELDGFRFDEEYEDNEEEWKKIRAEILGEGSDDDSGSNSGSESESESEDEQEAADQELAPSGEKKTVVIEDLSETDLVHLRRTIYLTIMSSATFEECTHKLAKMDIPDGRECELVNMIIECCSQERTFLRYYGLVSGRFCLLHERWQDAFEEGFATQYNTIHRLETNKLRNVAKLFGHLLHTDSISWGVLSCIHLNEDETTSSSRIFIKILVQEMAEAMGMVTLKQRFDTDNPAPEGPVGEDATAVTVAAPSANHEPSSREWYKGMFPKDNARNTRYAINFFTSIGLGPLTDGMREFLKNAPKLILAQAQAQAAREAARKEKDDDESSVISSSSSDTSSFDSSSSSSGSSMSSSSRSSYSSSSSYTSYSSDSRYRRKKGGGRGRGRDRKRGRGRRSRSYSSSSSGSDSSPDSRGGRRKYSSKDKRGGGRRGGRSSSNSRVRKDDASRDSRNDDASSKANLDAGSKRRSVSVSPPRGRKDNRRGSSRRSYSSSRSRSPGRGGSSEKRRGDNSDGRRSKSSRNKVSGRSSPTSPGRKGSTDLPPNEVDKQQQQQRGGRKKRSRSTSFSSASRSRSPPARKSSRRGQDDGDRKRNRSGRERSNSRSISSRRN